MRQPLQRDELHKELQKLLRPDDCDKYALVVGAHGTGPFKRAFTLVVSPPEKEIWLSFAKSAGIRRCVIPALREDEPSRLATSPRTRSVSASARGAATPAKHGVPQRDNRRQRRYVLARRDRRDSNCPTLRSTSTSPADLLAFRGRLLVAIARS